MLIKLLPDNIAANWATVAPDIQRAFGDQELGIGKMRNILWSILKGDVEARVYSYNGIPKALLLMSITIDKLSQRRSLFVHTITSMARLDDNDAEELIADLQHLARELDCYSLSGLVDNAALVRYYSMLGFDVKTTHVNMEV